MNLWNKLIHKLKNVYEYVLDIDNAIWLVLKMLVMSLFFLVLLFSMEYVFYIFYEPWPSPTSSTAFNPFLFIHFIVDLLVILVYCILIRKYIGNKKYRILSFFLVVLLLIMFVYYDPHFLGRVLIILFSVYVNHYVETFFEFEEYNHPPIHK